MPTLSIPDHLRPIIQRQIDTFNEPILKMYIAMHDEKIEASTETIQEMQMQYIDNLDSFRGWSSRKKNTVFQVIAERFLNDQILHQSLYQATQESRFGAFDLFIECIPDHSSTLTDMLVSWKKKAQSPQDIANMMRWCNNQTLFPFEQAFAKNVNAYQCVEWTRRLTEGQHDRLFVLDKVWENLFGHQMQLPGHSDPILTQSVRTLLTAVNWEHNKESELLAIGAVAIALNPNVPNNNVPLETLLPYINHGGYYSDESPYEEKYDSLREHVIYALSNQYDEIQVASAIWTMSKSHPQIWRDDWLCSLVEDKFIFGTQPQVWRALALELEKNVPHRYVTSIWTWTPSEESKNIADAWNMLYDLQVVSTDNWAWLQHVRLENGTLVYSCTSTPTLESPVHLGNIELT